MTAMNGTHRWARRSLELASAGALAVALTACAGPASTPTASPSPEPMFSTDQEAYDAAVESYKHYLKVYASISAEGGARSERILDVAGTEHANQLLEEFRSMSDAGVHTTGETELISSQLEEIDSLRGHFELQLCLGVGTSRVIDAGGTDVTSDREPVVPLVVTFDANSASSILITGSVVWSGENFC